VSPSKPRQLVLVMAHWCPHCYPLSVDEGKRYARSLGVPMRMLDIDVPEQEREADRWVERYGDNDPDYLIPQLFLEFEDGSVEHLLTGVPGSLSGTRAKWARLLRPAPPAA
jgi:hypothetical protein